MPHTPSRSTNSETSLERKTSESKLAKDTLAVDIKHCDLNEPMKDLAVKLAIEAVSTLESESEMASFIKKEFDKQYDGKWHCIIGRAYGSYVTHDEQRFIYMQVGNEVILLFKST